MAGEVFKKPVPKEALDYFNSKDLKIGFDYRDVWRAEHAYSFTVAKAMTVDILEDIQGAVSKAIKEGKTFHQFQKELKPILQQKGWWGRKDMRDPLTGEIKDVQLGSPRRLKTIYRANMRTARGAGKWERIQRTKQALPYLLYQLGPAERHRPEHAAWNGVMLPADDPFWQTHFTPNGWGCKCWIRQISKNEHGRLKSRDGYSTTAPPINNEDWINKRTGAVEKVPKGIHPGWDTNPAFVRQIRELKNGNLSNLFIASSTIKEAEKYLIDNDIVDTVDFGNIKDMTLVNDWNRALYESIKEFPELRKNQYFTGSSQVQIKKLYDLQIEKLTQKFIAMGLDPEEVVRRVKKYKPKLKKVMGFAQSMSDKEVGGITFNEVYEKGVAELMRDAAELNYWAKGSGSMKYVVDHELGHQLDNLLLIRENKDVKSLFKKLKKESLLKIEVSIYAEENASNIKEFIAESWAEYRNAPIPRESAKKVGDLIVKQYGDRFR